MALFQWNSSFETGHSTIDLQHQSLVNIINQLGDLVAVRLESNLPLGLFQELLDYTQYHFLAEENIFLNDNVYPDEQALAHQQTHRDFVSHLGKLARAATDRTAAQQLLNYLVEWLVGHILKTDKEMVPRLSGNSSSQPVATMSAENQLLEALQESEARFHLFADSTPALLWLSDSQGERTFFNQSWIDLTGVKNDALLAGQWLRLIHADDRLEYQNSTRLGHQQQQGYEAEYRVETKREGYHWVHEKTVPRVLPSGVFIGMTGSCMDISTLKDAQQLQQSLNDELQSRVERRTQELVDKNKKLRAFYLQLKIDKKQQEALIDQLQQAQRQLVQTEKMAAIGHLAAGVAHEINNPIGYVNSNVMTLESYVAQLLQLLDAYEGMEDAITGHPGYNALRVLKTTIDPAYLVKDVKELLDESKEGLGRVKQIVQDLKDFSRSENGVWAYADLHQCLDSTLNVASNELKYKAKILKEYGDLPEVECLSHQLCQVFLNLLINAAHAFADQGQITLRTRATDKTVIVDIVDDGAGIAAENLSKIFNPFFTTKPVGQGTGLGLSLSYEIIQHHQGTMSVTSTLGEGTQFRIELPIVQPLSAPGGCMGQA